MAVRLLEDCRDRAAGFIRSYAVKPVDICRANWCIHLPSQGTPRNDYCKLLS